MTASRYDLLPPNATPLERDISRATSSLQRVAPPVPIIRTAKRVDIPDSIIPWLVYEYGLGELLPYVTNQRQLVADGVLWQRIRGTPESICIALGWVDAVGEVEESEAGTLRWAEYQIQLGQPPRDLSLIDRIVGVTRIAQPVRSRLFRVYSGYDERRFLLDHHLLGEGLLCDHSGVYLQPDWPQLSFGQRFPASIDVGIEVGDTYTHISGVQAIYPDTFRLDYGFLDDGWHVLNHPLIRSTVYTSVAFLGAADSDWGSDPWVDVDGWGKRFAVIAPAYKFSKAQVVLSDSWALGDINSCFPVTTTVEVGHTIELSSEDQISDTYWALEFEGINERFFSERPSAPAVYTSTPEAQSAGLRVHIAAARTGYAEPWDARSWASAQTWVGTLRVGASHVTT